MILPRLPSGVDMTDRDFDAMYSGRLRALAKLHFTPVDVARAAARFLVTRPGTRVLDVGAGAGKFCIVGALSTSGHFTGVEQRAYLCRISELHARYLGALHTRFIHANVVDVDFSDFDAFYVYNPFSENILLDDPLDNTVELDRSLYARYSEFVHHHLAQMPVGTRLATYHSFQHEVPQSYVAVDSGFEGKLKMWEKE
jgi:SAM-dependent methyltransferase